MAIFDELSRQIKQDPAKHYRWVSSEPEKLSRRKAQGFSFVSPQDSAVKGTSLEGHLDDKGRINVGDMILMQTSKKRAGELQAVIDNQNKLRQDAIENKYREAGEGIKRALGKKHRGFDVIVEKET
jgi:hypothetical protein